MSNLPLAFAELLAGGVAAVAGISGSSIADVMEGNVTMHPFDLGLGGSSSSSTTGGPSGPGPYSPAQVAQIAQQLGAPANLAKWLGDTSVPESGGDPSNVNSSSGATGLLQILPSAWPQLDAGRLKDPTYNVASALYVLSQQGSSAWSGSGTWRGPPVAPGQYHFPKP